MNLTDRLESISEGENTNEQHNHEDRHVFDAGNDHSNEPAEIFEDSDFEQESEPNAQGYPRLDWPEFWRFQVLIDSVYTDENECC